MKNKKIYGNLYNTPYQENVDDVLKVLDSFPKSCRKTFLKNLRTLKIIEISEEELKKYNQMYNLNIFDLLGVYLPDNNSISFSKKITHPKETINHELFHISSIRKGKKTLLGKRIIGKKEYEFGLSLNEGITEYLAIKSLNKPSEIVSYELEVFLIRCLVDIYGEKILIPYFKQSPRKFYGQFKKDNDTIKKVDILLKELSVHNKLIFPLKKYILLNETNQSILKEKNLYIEKLECFIDFLIDNTQKINDLFEQETTNNVELNNILNSKIPYQLKLKENQVIYDTLIKLVEISFNKVLKGIIVMGRNKSLTDDEIKNILIKNLKYPTFTINKMEYKNKKLIRK